MINNMTQSERCFVHAFTQPNRGYQGHGKVPAYQQEDFDWMASVAGPLDVRGWKLYCGWGDPGLGAARRRGPEPQRLVVRRRQRHGHRRAHPPHPGQDQPARQVICTHKGLAFNGTFDSAKFSPRDMGIIGAQFPDITFFTYHSGYDGEHMKAYAGDDQVNSSNRGVDCFIKSLRENGVDATRFVPKGLEHGNSPNMYAEIGTTWWANMSDADRATHLLGKLITYVGPRRIVWGSDCIWYGNPQPQIVLLRALQFSEQAKEFYNLPYGLDGDRWDPRKNALDASSYMVAHPNIAGLAGRRQGPPRADASATGSWAATPPSATASTPTPRATPCRATRSRRSATPTSSTRARRRRWPRPRSNFIIGPRTKAGVLGAGARRRTRPTPNKFTRFPD